MKSFYKTSLIILIATFLSQIKSESLKNKNLRKVEELSDDIVILHINDVHCALNNTIGYDGFALYREELKKKYKYIISADVGDHIQGGVLGSLTNGEAIIEVKNKVGFDVVSLGNHEFDFGVEQLFKLKDNITSKYICSNFYNRKNNTRIFDPYKIINIGGKKIAFIGVVTPLTLTKTFLSTVKDEDGELVYDFLADGDGTRLVTNTQEVIDEIKQKENPDYIILLTHIGMEEEEFTSDGLLSKLNGVTAVLDGHTHKIYNVTSKDKNGNDIHISQTGTKLQAVGELILKQDGSIATRIIDEIPEPTNIQNSKTIFRAKKDRWVDKEMSEFLDSIWAKYEDELKIEVGYSDFDLVLKPEESADSSLSYCRIRECTLGNLVTDAMKQKSGADICIVNGGAIRNGIKKGNLTKSQLIEVLPYFDDIVIKEVSGQDILDVLEFGVSNLPKSSGRFPLVSGITYDVDTSFNSTALIDASGFFVNVTGKRRVSNVKINGDNLDLNKTYKTAFCLFMANGGDGYSMLSKYDVIKEALLTESDLLGIYIKEDLNGVIPEKYKELEGRINFKSNDSEESENKNKNTGLSPTVIIASIASIFIIALIYFLKLF